METCITAFYFLFLVLGCLTFLCGLVCKFNIAKVWSYLFSMYFLLLHIALLLIIIDSAMIYNLARFSSQLQGWVVEILGQNRKRRTNNQRKISGDACCISKICIMSEIWVDSLFQHQHSITKTTQIHNTTSHFPHGFTLFIADTNTSIRDKKFIGYSTDVLFWMEPDHT